MTPAPGGKPSVQDAVLHDQWGKFLQDYCSTNVVEASLSFPEVQSVIVDFGEVQNRSPELADYLLAKPTHALRQGAKALLQVDVPVEPRPKLHLRVHQLPKGERLSVRALRAEHLGRLVAVEGFVRKATSADPHVKEAVFECKVCTTRAHVIQEDDFLQEPVFCETCEKQQPWRFLEEESRCVNLQKLELAEPPEELRGGQQPERIAVTLMDDLVHSVRAGQRVRINGILTAQPRRENGKRRTTFTKALAAVSVEVLESSFDEMHLTDADIEAARTIAARPDLTSFLVAGFAPSVYGHDLVKQGLLLAMVGAPSRSQRGNRQRGEIHVLLLGDPGIAKTKILRRVVDLSPRGIFTSAKASSTVGLTGTSVQDDFLGKGAWGIEAGALPMAHKGTLGLDELPQLPEEQREALYEAMEDGTVTIRKAASAEFRAEVSVIATGNPIGGRFDPNQPMYEQLGLAPALVSRFDLVYCMRDVPNEAEDERVADHIIDMLNGTSARLASSDTLSDDELRRYIAVAKRVEPRVSDEARAYLRQRHVSLRRQVRSDGPPVTHRLMATMGRLALARARLHLRETATLEDAKVAWQLLHGSLRSLGAVRDDGTLDASILTNLRTTDQMDRIRVVQKVVRELAAASPKAYALRDDIVQSLVARGYLEGDIDRDLQTLVRNNTLFHKGGAHTYALLSG